ncbi:MAG: alpha/beta hydrolase [Gammaproteobacteria bacterium]|nr:alpha/beta hydrolase [Gammaproteobacteria bacterium]MDP6734174.1 alpha/beta hydrolase [Gammaproteobacteria bacterium]
MQQLNLGGSGSVLHFSHANGYPPMAYRAMLKPFLQQYEVIASLHRPVWNPPPEPSSMKSWQDFGVDLLHSLDSIDATVISVGHSMGAAAIVMAADKKPERFSKIVLIEPLLMPARYFYFLKLLRPLARRRVPLIRRTLQRIDRWSSREEAFEHFRPKQVFKRISDEVLWDYVNHGVNETQDGTVCLAYSREWEAHCYLRAASIWKSLLRLDLPILAIRGGDSNTVSRKSWNKWQSLSPRHQYVEIKEAGHLVPFERPELIASIIRQWIEKIS